jgi:hypothetical protein
MIREQGAVDVSDSLKGAGRAKPGLARVQLKTHSEPKVWLKKPSGSECLRLTEGSRLLNDDVTRNVWNVFSCKYSVVRYRVTNVMNATRLK